jgi:hypothetical protein
MPQTWTVSVSLFGPSGYGIFKRPQLSTTGVAAAASGRLSMRSISRS